MFKNLICYVEKITIETMAIDCIFSDHNFAISTLDFHFPKLSIFLNMVVVAHKKKIFCSFLVF